MNASIKQDNNYLNSYKTLHLEIFIIAFPMWSSVNHFKKRGAY
jgi:hypothetical protein